MRGQATLTKDEAEKLVQSACAAMAAELARLRAELEQAPTATLRQQLAGSQSALSKVMGELTEAREQLERRRIDYAKVQADLYNQIEAEKAQTAEAYRQRDIARAALAEAERERDEARADVDTLARSYLKPYARALKQDPDDGGYSATIIEFAGCYSEGETRDEALANIEDAATGWMLAALSMGQTIPEPMKYRRTIRALVVAARVARLAAVGFAFIAGVGPRRVHDEIRFGIKQSKQQADRKAEKE